MNPEDQQPIPFEALEGEMESDYAIYQADEDTYQNNIDILDKLKSHKDTNPELYKKGVEKYIQIKREKMRQERDQDRPDQFQARPEGGSGDVENREGRYEGRPFREVQREVRVTSRILLDPNASDIDKYAAEGRFRSAVRERAVVYENLRGIYERYVEDDDPPPDVMEEIVATAVHGLASQTHVTEADLKDMYKSFYVEAERRETSENSTVYTDHNNTEVTSYRKSFRGLIKYGLENIDEQVNAMRVLRNPDPTNEQRERARIVYETSSLVPLYHLEPDIYAIFDAIDSGGPVNLPTQNDVIAQRMLDVQEQQLVELQVQRAQKEKEDREAKIAYIWNIFDQDPSSDPHPSKENWYSHLSDAEKKLINASHKILSALELKRGDDPEKRTEDFIGSMSFMRKDFEAIGNLEGAQIAMATQMHELYDLKEIDSGYGGVLEGAEVLRLSDEQRINIDGQMYSAVEIFKDKEKGLLSKYRESLVDRVGYELFQNPRLIGMNLMEEGMSQEDASRAAARAFVGVTWALGTYGLVVEGADEDRKAGVLADFAFTSKFRRLLHPYSEANSKFVKQEGETVGLEDAAFGKLGKWATERCRHDPRFKQDLRDYKKGRRYFLKTTLGSMYDHVRYQDGESISQKMMDPDNVVREDNGRGPVYKFRDYDSTVNFNSLKDEDVAFAYKIKLDSVFKTQDLVMTKGDVRDNEAAGKFNEFLLELKSLEDLVYKSDPILMSIYQPEQMGDFVIGAIGAVSGGFKEYSFYNGKTVELLNTGLVGYDNHVLELLSNDLVYRVTNLNKGQIMKRIYAMDVYSMRQAFFGDKRKLRRDMIGEFNKVERRVSK